MIETGTKFFLKFLSIEFSELIVNVKFFPCPENSPTRLRISAKYKSLRSKSVMNPEYFGDNYAIVTGLDDGDLVIKTQIPEIFEGMKVKIID